MKNSNFLKILLIVQSLTLFVYTIFCFQKEGANLLSVFVNNIVALGWNGQFNLDFSCYLMLSGLWIMWRNNFTLKSIFIAITASIVGIMVFAPYFLFLLIKEKGDLKRTLTGNH
ncbi:hypothetical protein [Chryseobacterium gambrini]|uniref:hypothetical protein n=1 Tax=Chryseobacterium gambrini TaxID=373672 RepID=UPI0022F3CDD9|nr:hypothetical protein [Chryseobacterium gambrini]WBX98718.1 hypothetical protein PE065_05540 [Chryseobacterium gambrini]